MTMQVLPENQFRPSLSLYAYRNDGTKLVTGVVVMYRVYVEGRWLPWVSNANPDWMRSVQAKYNLDGLTGPNKRIYAGIAGKNISGIEVRIFGKTILIFRIPLEHQQVNLKL